MGTNKFEKQAYKPARIHHCDIASLEKVEKELVRICHWLDVRDVEIFLVSELFERSGNSRVHVVPMPLISPSLEELQI